METRPGKKPAISDSESSDRPALPRSKPLPIPQRNRHASIRSSSSAREQEAHLMFKMDEDSSSCEDSDDEKPASKEKPQQVHQGKSPDKTATPDKHKSTILNILSSSPVRVTISPQLRSGLGLHTPPLLSLTPQHSPKHRSRSPSKLRQPQQLAGSHSDQPEAPATLLNILGGTPNLTLKISPRLDAQKPPHPLPPLRLSPQVSPRHTHPVLAHDLLSQTHEIKTEEEKEEGIQIILPGGEDRWAIEVTEDERPETLDSASETEPFLSRTRSPHSRNDDRSSSDENQYRELLKDIAYHLLLIALVSPNAMNAFCEPSGVKPADISADWWNNLSTETQLLSISNALFSLGVNVFVQRDFIPQALKELRESFGKCFKSPTDFLSNSLTLISSSAAAFSFAAMSYEAFKWVGDVASIVPGLASLGTSFTTRYPSVKKATLKVSLFFDEDMRSQREMADRLRHLTREYANAVSVLVHTKHYKLHNKDLAHLLDSLGSDVEGIPFRELLSPRTAKDYLKEYALMTLEASFSTVIASTAFLTFTQKGFDGTNAIAHLLHGNIDDLSPLEQFAIGGVGGTVSAMLYAIAALNFLPTAAYVSSELFWDLVHASRRLACHPIATLHETTENPQRLFRFLKLTLGSIAVWRSSGAMITVGNGVIHNKKGIFMPLFDFWPAYGAAFPALNGLGGVAINFTSTINQILKKEREERKKTPELEDFARHLEEMPLSTTLEVPQQGETHPVPTLSYLKTFSLFKPSPAAKTQIEMVNYNSQTVDNEMEDEDNQSLPLLEDPGLEDRPAHQSACSRVSQWFGFG